MTTTDDLPELGPTGADHLTSILRALAGMAPWGGAALIEIINGVIPHQRSDRIEVFLLELRRRVSELEEDKGKIRLRQPESIDLLEDGAYQAARALSDNRIQYISKCVADGITNEHLDYLQSKRILRILNELDDAEIIYLAGRFSDWPDDWYPKHASPIFYSWGWREGVKAADFLGLGVVRAEYVVPRGS